MITTTIMGGRDFGQTEESIEAMSIMLLEGKCITIATYASATDIFDRLMQKVPGAGLTVRQAMGLSAAALSDPIPVYTFFIEPEVQ